MRAYFLTVDWCNVGNRGIFTDRSGHCFRKDGSPHTEQEMQDILGPFYLVLVPQSLPMTDEELRQFNRFVALAEYSDKYGIAITARAAPST